MEHIKTSISCLAFRSRVGASQHERGSMWTRFFRTADQFVMALMMKHSGKSSSLGNPPRRGVLFKKVIGDHSAYQFSSNLLACRTKNSQVVELLNEEAAQPLSYQVISGLCLLEHHRSRRRAQPKNATTGVWKSVSFPCLFHWFDGEPCEDAREGVGK